MLDAFIIEELRRQREKAAWQPVPLELPIPLEPLDRESDQRDDGSDPSEGSPGGVVIIDPEGEESRL